MLKFKLDSSKSVTSPAANVLAKLLTSEVKIFTNSHLVNTYKHGILCSFYFCNIVAFITLHHVCIGLRKEHETFFPWKIHACLPGLNAENEKIVSKCGRSNTWTKYTFAYKDIIFYFLKLRSETSRDRICKILLRNIISVKKLQ